MLSKKNDFTKFVVHSNMQKIMPKNYPQMTVLTQNISDKSSDDQTVRITYQENQTHEDVQDQSNPGKDQ